MTATRTDVGRGTRRRLTSAIESVTTTTRRAGAILLAVAIAVLASGCEDGQLPGVAGEAAPEIGAAVDVLVLQHLEDQNVPGATVAVTRNGRLVLSKGYGVADMDTGAQMEPWHRTRIGSVSKVLTAIGVLQLVEQGELDLDDHLYGSSATPIWGSDPSAPPGVIHADDAALDDAGDYLVAATEAVERWAPAPGDDTSELPGYLTQGSHQANVAELLDWMTEVQLRHALSHTAGYLGSGDLPAAAARFDKDDLDVTYPELHQAMMAGESQRPFRFRPGTDRAYSNHGFGLLGQLIAERGGAPYVDHMEANVLHPLGLHDVVPVDVVSLESDLDATGYDVADGQPIPPLPENVIEREVPAISTSTGGWAASARDVARIVCGVDVASNHLRLLDQDTAATMVSPAVPELSSIRVLGWDRSYGTPSVTKGGSTARGGGARVTKYLPGGPHGAEINVVVNTNRRGSPPIELLRAIADVVAAAEVADDYDLFPASHRCVGEPPTLDILQPGQGSTFRLGEEIHAEAIARDVAGDPLPITWLLPDGRSIDAVPSPSDGRVSLFTDDLPVGTHTLRARATDAGGFEATDEVTIEVVYDAPTVTIVTPSDGAAVSAAEDLLLVGHSTMGAHFTLLDHQVGWQVLRDGEVVHAAAGHVDTVPAGSLDAGDHTIVFTGSDGVETVGTQVEIHVLPTPTDRPDDPPTDPPADTDEPDVDEPDEPNRPSRPATATIERPDEDGVVASGPGGTAVEVGLAGSATDVTGEAIDGTRFRWTVTKAGDATTVVCEGSAFDPDAEPDGAADQVEDCTSFLAALQPAALIGGSGTAFVIGLEARASDGTIAADVRVIHVVVPPVS